MLLGISSSHKSHYPKIFYDDIFGTHKEVDITPFSVIEIRFKIMKIDAEEIT